MLFGCSLLRIPYIRPYYTDSGRISDLHDVPIARTGKQDYLGRETPDPKIDADAIIPVYRPEEEVFSKPTLASFEGKPVTDNHPLEDITSQNVSVYMKGIVKNVHQWHRGISGLHCRRSDYL